MTTTQDIEARAQREGLSIPDLLKRAGINRATWWRWSTGRFQPRAETVDRIEAALKLSRK
jgi:transcriptional regulator with XRE-family HTH domain